MKVSEAIERVKERKPNAYSDSMLLDWLNEIEARVQSDLMDTTPEGVISYDIERDMERELLLPRPHDSLYLTFVIMMIEFNQQEYTAYNNSAELFNTQFADAQKYYNEKYKKVKPLKITNWGAL